MGLRAAEEGEGGWGGVRGTEGELDGEGEFQEDERWKGGEKNKVYIRGG